jgi:hypothetical protein
MTEGDGIVDGIAKEPSQKNVANWLVNVYKDIPEKIRKNAWEKTGFEWF